MPTFRRAAISVSAPATSSAWARLSSWHGPAMIEIGKSLPNLTDPAATTGAAKRFAFKLFSLFRTGPWRAAAAGSTGFSRFEYQGCAVGRVRRHPQPSHMALRGNSVLPMQGLDRSHIRNRKAHRVERHPLPSDVERNGELIAKRDRLHDFDIAISGAGLDADRARMQIAHPGERLEEDMVVGRIVGDHRRTQHGSRAIGVGLERRIPEILRKMMLAHR